jgi:hypothetical protein
MSKNKIVYTEQKPIPNTNDYWHVTVERIDSEVVKSSGQYLHVICLNHRVLDRWIDIYRNNPTFYYKLYNTSAEAIREGIQLFDELPVTTQEAQPA